MSMWPTVRGSRCNNSVDIRHIWPDFGRTLDTRKDPQGRRSHDIGLAVNSDLMETGTDEANLTYERMFPCFASMANM
jgi:hypothetical protein